MSPSRIVLALPPSMTHTGKWQLRENPAGGYAKEDGTLTEAWNAREGLTFETADKAIRWAKARNWQVLNEGDPDLRSVR